MSPDAINPWGILKYIHLPHSMINMVSGWLTLSRVIAWYPSTASNTVFSVLGGIWQAVWKGDDVWCVSHWCWAFSHWRYMVHLGGLFFFDVITMGQHHWNGVPIGTGVIIPHPTLLSRLCLTDYFKWYGTGIGVCLA